MTIFRPDEKDSVYIGEGTELKGSIRARDTIVIDGYFDGEIACSHLLVGPSGVVKGALTVSSAVIAGDVTAEITTRDLLIVRATGRLAGKWNCGAIEVARGAVLDGSIIVTQASAVQRRDARPEEPEIEAEYELDEEVVVEQRIATVTPLLKPRGAVRLGHRMPRRSVG